MVGEGWVYLYEARFLYFSGIVFVVVVKNTHPCVAGVDGFLSRVINDVVDYLVNGDVPSHVLKEGYDAYAGW